MPKSNDKCFSATILWPFTFVRCQASNFMNLQQAVLARKGKSYSKSIYKHQRCITREDVVNGYSVTIW